MMPFSTALSRFRKDRGGNFAMTLAISALPLLAGVGLAVDYTMMTSARSSLQNANDAAVLFASRHYEVNGRLPETSAIDDMVQANFAGEIISSSAKIEGDNIILDTRARDKFVIIGLFTGNNSSTVSVRSAAPIFKNITMEVAMALDTTYSMSADGKMDGLKTAATNFVNDMMALVKPSVTIKMGVVPFANYVNVGLHNRGAKWLSVPDDKTENVKGYCYMTRDVTGSSNCREETAYADGVPYTYQACDYTYGPEREVCVPDSEVTTKWWGCVGSRAAPLTLRDSNPNTPIPGITASWDMTGWECPTPLTPLTTNKAELLAAINALTPRGDTYIVDGVMWGQRILSPIDPFNGTDPAKVSGKTRKVLVLMSDGDNTKSSSLPDDPGNNGTDRALADDWTRDACKHAKTKGTEVFTITFGKEVSAESKKIMKGCASTKENYFDASNTEALKKAFADIAVSLTRVRLTM